MAMDSMEEPTIFGIIRSIARQATIWLSVLRGLDKIIAKDVVDVAFATVCTENAFNGEVRNPKPTLP